MEDANKVPELANCTFSLFKKSTDDTPNYLNALGFSGKELSDLGLMHECLGAGFNYHLITYQFINGSFIKNNIQTNSFIFFQQHTFYTGLCLPKGCTSILQFLFNKTVDQKLYDFLLNYTDIINVRIYTIRSANDKNNALKKDPTITYDIDGKYNETKTKNEYYKYVMFNIFFYIIISIIFLQIIISIILYIFYKPILNARKLKEEKIEEKEEESSEIAE